MRRRPALRARTDTSGSVAPLVGLVMAALFGFAGLGVDLGMVYLEKRRVQSAADLAALAAARSNNSSSVALRTLADNGYPVPSGFSVTPGTYTADRAVAPGSRFAAGGTAPNATRVHLASSVRAGFSRVVGGPASYAVSADATATRADLAAFSIGSRLLSIDGGIANALLSRLLGTTVSLSVADYRALATLNVDALGFLRAAAPKIGIRAATYSDVLTGTLSMPDFMGALNQAIDRSTAPLQALTALNTLSAALSGTGAPVRLAGLLTAGDLGNAPLSPNSQALFVNALDLVTGAGMVANGTNQVSLDLGTAVPGLLRSRISLRIGEAMRTSGYVGPGASLSTAQKRLLLEVWIPGPLLLPDIYLPIYVEVAPAKATVKTVTCPWRAASERAVGLEVATGIAYLAFASVGPAALDPGAARPALTPVTILQAPFLTVGATAAVEVGASTQTVTFGDADIKAGRYRTVSTNNLAGSLVGSLLSSMDLRLNGAALGGILELKGALATVIGAAAAPIDALLFSTLGIAGVKVGSADVTVTGTYCGGAALVQ